MTTKDPVRRTLFFSLARYFRFFARFALKRWNPRVIVVTGSVGKTSMLELLEQELGDRAHYSHGANSVFGISFDILGLKGISKSYFEWFGLILKAPFKAFTVKHQEIFYVAEVDADFPGKAEFVAKFLQPEVSLWISLGDSHSEFFEPLVESGRYTSVSDAIAASFASVPEATQKLCIIDGENRDIVRWAKSKTAEIQLAYSTIVKKYEVSANQTAFTTDSGVYRFNQPIPRDFATQLAILEKLMRYLELPIKYDLEGFNLSPGRNNFLEGKNGLQIIDSSYNAHLISMESILEMVQETNHPHTWLILGDMVEQGSQEAKEHTALAPLIDATKAERVILIGRRLKQYTYPALKKTDRVVLFDGAREALGFLEKNLTGREMLVFKGSQHLEWIIEKLLKNQEDKQKLARQDLMSLKRKQKKGLV